MVNRYLVSLHFFFAIVNFFHYNLIMITNLLENFIFLLYHELLVAPLVVFHCFFMALKLLEDLIQVCSLLAY